MVSEAYPAGKPEINTIFGWVRVVFVPVFNTFFAHLYQLNERPRSSIFL